MPCSKQMVSCKRGCLHRRMVGEWRDAYIAWEAAMDEVAMGYPEEERDYRRDNPPILFKDWLIAMRR